MSRHFDLVGKGILLTGGSSGIGAAIARQLAARGCERVGIAARGVERLNALVDEIGSNQPQPIPLQADLSKPGHARTLAREATEALGRVDVLINNAGGAIHGLQWVAGDRTEGREMFETNFWSPLALISELLPGMLERGSGAIANVTSTMQVSPFPSMGHLAASKSALAIATQTLRLEAERAGIHVLEAPFGMVDTAGLAESALLPGGEVWMRTAPKGSAEGAAKRLIRGLEQQQRVVVYPRSMLPVYHLAFIGRAFSRAFSRYVDPASEDLSVRGTHGSEAHKHVRSRWEADHRTGSAGSSPGPPRLPR